MTPPEQPIEMENGSTTNYLQHFNTVINNYGAALLESGQGSKDHARCALAVDHLAKEYATATDLLDRVRGHCERQIEQACLEGGDFLTVAEAFATTYPPLTTALYAFCEILKIAYPRGET